MGTGPFAKYAVWMLDEPDNLKAVDGVVQASIERAWLLEVNG